MIRLLRSAAVLAILAFATVRPAHAQRTAFEPRLYLFGSYASNVDVVDDEADPGASSEAWDSSVNLGVELPVTREMRAGAIGFSYSGVYTRYDRNTVYDNMAHGVSLSFRPRLRSSGATLSTDVFYSLSQDQGTPRRIDEDTQFLAVRTDRSSYGARAQYTKDARRSYWEAGLRGTRSEFEAIAGTIPDTLPPDPQALELVPESRTYWYGSVEYRHKFSRRFSLGPRYELGYAQLERNSDELFHVLTASFAWMVSQYFSIDANLGAYRRSSEGDPALGAESGETTGFAWKLTLRIDPPLAAIQQGKIKLGLDVGISPSGGGALQGTSTDSDLRLYLASGTARSPWSWDIGIRYTRRESTLDTYPTLQNAGLGGFVEYAVGALLSARLSAGWSQQVDAGSDVTNASVETAGFGIVVYPKGRAASTGR